MPPQHPIRISVTTPPNARPYGQIWDPKTALYIRNNLRLLGDFTGTLPKHVAQSQHLSTPLTLSTEELVFGRERGWFLLYHDHPDFYHPVPEAPEIFRKERDAVIDAQVEEAVVKDAEERRKRSRKRPREEVQPVDDAPRKFPRLLEPLRAVWRYLTGARETQEVVEEPREATREELLANKTRRQARNSALVTTATAARDDERFDPVVIELELKSEKMTVFEDLHQKGYYISCGGKFGTDFLAYAGSPQLFHAAFAVVVSHKDEPFSAREIVALGRLGDATRKRTLLAYVTPSGVRYVGIQWEETLP